VAETEAETAGARPYDVMFIREVAEELLRSAGLDVETAWDGARAVELALSRRYDLILMDMQMPVVDGLEATVAIRQRSTAATPIVAMRANAFAEDRAACLAAGMNDHLAKPVDPALMFSVLLRWLPLRSIDRSSDAFANVVPVAGAGSVSERLAAIDGFDFAFALKSVAGQTSALIRVLRRFVVAYKNGVPILMQPYSEMDGTDIAWRAACHSLRGALDTLGARAVLQQLATFEQQLNQAGPSSLIEQEAQRLQQMLVQFAAELNEVMGAAERAL
jgi:CheY-like chemotaxis protein